MRRNGIPYYDISDEISNLDVWSGKLKTKKSEALGLRNIHFELADGKCYVCDREKRKYETMYVHFQKRKCQIKDEGIMDHWYLYAPNVVSIRKQTVSGWDCIAFWTKQFIFRVKRKLKKEIRRRYGYHEKCR